MVSTRKIGLLRHMLAYVHVGHTIHLRGEFQNLLASQHDKTALGGVSADDRDEPERVHRWHARLSQGCARTAWARVGSSVVTT